MTVKIEMFWVLDGTVTTCCMQQRPVASYSVLIMLSIFV